MEGKVAVGTEIEHLFSFVSDHRGRKGLQVLYESVVALFLHVFKVF